LIMTAADKKEDSESLSQEDLDALISGAEQDDPAAGGDIDEPLSQEDPDALVSEAEQDDPAAGGDIDEPLSQENPDALVSEAEQDDPTTGGDLDEPLSQGDLDALISEAEQDEPATEGKIDEQFSQEDLDKLISGDELDESIAKDEPESEIEYEETTKEKDAEDPEKKYKGKNKLVIFAAEKYKHQKKKLFIAAAVSLCLLTGAGYLSLQNKKEKAPEAIKLSVKVGRSLVFDSFVIPFREHDKFAYLSLDISFRLKDQEVAEEMTTKRDMLRGIIYDLLREEVNKTGKLPQVDKLKKYIVEGVNNALSTGKVREAYIVDFLAV